MNDGIVVTVMPTLCIADLAVGQDRMLDMVASKVFGNYRRTVVRAEGPNRKMKKGPRSSCGMIP